MKPRPVRSWISRGRAGRWAAWWVLGFMVWLALDDTVVVAELIAGVIAAALGATAVTVATDGIALATPRLGWGRRAWRLPLGLIGQLGLLMRVLLVALSGGGRSPGRLVTVPFGAAGEHDHDHDGVRAALAVWAGSLAPGSVIVAIDQERHEMLVHELVPGRGGADPLGLG